MPDLRRSIGVVPVLAPRFSWCLMDLTEVWGPTYILKGYTMLIFNNNAFVVHTQTMVNENTDTASAHNWKCRGGNTYVVRDVTSPSNAIAFIMSAFACNTTSNKEFPKTSSAARYLNWVEETMESVRSCNSYDGVFHQEEANAEIDHIMSSVYIVSPLTKRQKFQPDGPIFGYLEDTSPFDHYESDEDFDESELIEGY